MTSRRHWHKHSGWIACARALTPALPHARTARARAHTVWHVSHCDWHSQWHAAPRDTERDAGFEFLSLSLSSSPPNHSIPALSFLALPLSSQSQSPSVIPPFPASLIPLPPHSLSLSVTLSLRPPPPLPWQFTWIWTCFVTLLVFVLNVCVPFPRAKLVLSKNAHSPPRSFCRIVCSNAHARNVSANQPEIFSHAGVWIKTLPCPLWGG